MNFIHISQSSILLLKKLLYLVFSRYLHFGSSLKEKSNAAVGRKTEIGDKPSKGSATLNFGASCSGPHLQGTADQDILSTPHHANGIVSDSEPEESDDGPAEPAEPIEGLPFENDDVSPSGSSDDDQDHNDIPEQPVIYPHRKLPNNARNRKTPKLVLHS